MPIRNSFFQQDNLLIKKAILPQKPAQFPIQFRQIRLLFFSAVKVDQNLTVFSQFLKRIGFHLLFTLISNLSR